MRTSGCLWLRIAIPSGPVQVTWQLGDAGTTLDEIEARFRVIVFHGEVSRMLDEGQSREGAGGGGPGLLPHGIDDLACALIARQAE